MTPPADRLAEIAALVSRIENRAFVIPTPLSEVLRLCAGIKELRAELARVTAERDRLRSFVDGLAQWQCERLTGPYDEECGNCRTCRARAALAGEP